MHSVGINIGETLINFRVRLIASVPGRHTGVNKTRWGHLKLCKVIMNYWYKLRSLKFGICFQELLANITL